MVQSSLWNILIRKLTQSSIQQNSQQKKRRKKLLINYYAFCSFMCHGSSRCGRSMLFTTFFRSSKQRMTLLIFLPFHFCHSLTQIRYVLQPFFLFSSIYHLSVKFSKLSFFTIRCRNFKCPFLILSGSVVLDPMLLKKNPCCSHDPSIDFSASFCRTMYLWPQGFPLNCEEIVQHSKGLRQVLRA